MLLLVRHRSPPCSPAPTGPADLRADQAQRGPGRCRGSRWTGSRRRPDRLERVAVGDQALAARLLEAIGVEDVDRAAPELGGALAGEPRADRRDGGPRHAEQVGERLLGQREAVAADPVAREQEPARRALVEAVQAVAGDGLGEVAEHRDRVPCRPSGGATRCPGTPPGSAPRGSTGRCPARAPRRPSGRRRRTPRRGRRSRPSRRS